MYLTPEKTRELAIKFGGNENNTGDTAVQIAILTERILHLTDYMKENKKDFLQNVLY
jgi:small subunit ribosomal protein S15